MLFGEVDTGFGKVSHVAPWRAFSVLSGSVSGMDQSECGCDSDEECDWCCDDGDEEDDVSVDTEALESDGDLYTSVLVGGEEEGEAADFWE